ncbi:MAG: tail fiber domain-containing protein [Flavobacteriales bacterium]|jgi:trimeric autotransporter adhesin|nr:tail fiber domain-containing protein [Flavobacteriales bacterium]MBT4931065.1 tail fiber domain-containing protein [Flavobacteriales bacterium]MBT5133527.1 tail fiber domain-containing protein [Flavobacteriales bacterium]MBT6131682.1 tail fiber domain-containing protein [Flavobacteriales bacterium]MBT6382368.1 tail fiber domain-containing protein [Flavobacteriales bacterium]
MIGDVDSAHLAMDGNDILAKYGADSADRVYLQRRGKLSIGNWDHTQYKAIFATDSNDYQGGYGGIFNYRYYPQGEHGWAAMYNFNNASSGGSNTFGVININQNSDSTDFGTYNFNYGNGYGNSYGTYNDLMYSADSAFGTYNSVANPTTNSFGVYNKLKSDNYYNHYGVYTQVDSTYYGYGTYNDLDEGTYQYGTYNNMWDANSYAYGNYNNIYYPYYGYGNYSRIYYPNYGYGSYNYVYYPTYSGYGTYNYVAASNGYGQYGIYNYVNQNSTGQAMGMYNYTRGSGYVYGLDNSVYGYGTYGNLYAVDNYTYASGTASGYTAYGTYNRTYNYRSGYSAYNYGLYNYTYSANGTYNYNYGLYNYSYTGSGTYRYNYALYSYAGGGTIVNSAGYFVGAVYSTGGYTSSDRNIKKNIADYDGALGDVMQLRARTYEFDLENNPTMGLPEEGQIGVIAQELETVFPELVKTMINPKVRLGEGAAREQGLKFTIIEEAQYDDEGNLEKEAQVEAGEELEFKAVNYDGLIPVLIKATQEQQEIIESQNATIDTLIQRIEALENN